MTKYFRKLREAVMRLGTHEKYVYMHDGYCPICEKETRFKAYHPWLRDHFLCEHCGSIPRERQLFKFLKSNFKNFEQLHILEHSPSNNFVKKLSPHYTECYYWEDKYPGEPVGNSINQNIECTTFKDESFDLVVHSDIFEHIFNPVHALIDTLRILKNGGGTCFVFPVYEQERSIKRAEMKNGNLHHLFDPEYHGSPNTGKALVTYHYGADIWETLSSALTSLPDSLYEYTLSHTNESDDTMGIEGKFLDVCLVTKKTRLVSHPDES